MKRITALLTILGIVIAMDGKTDQKEIKILEPPVAEKIRDVAHRNQYDNFFD